MNRMIFLQYAVVHESVAGADAPVHDPPHLAQLLLEVPVQAEPVDLFETRARKGAIGGRGKPLYSSNIGNGGLIFMIDGLFLRAQTCPRPGP
jgi:hypothetical protein